jgi:hypothetical protein
MFPTEVLPRARLKSTCAIASTMSALAQALLSDSTLKPLDTELAGFAIASDTMELVAAWLRGDYTIDCDHLAATLRCSSP